MRLTPRHRMKCLLAGKGPSHAEVCPETPETGSLPPAFLQDFPYPSLQGQPLNKVLLSNGASLSCQPSGCAGSLPQQGYF